MRTAAAEEMQAYDAFGPLTRRVISRAPVSLDVRKLAAEVGLPSRELAGIDVELSASLHSMIADEYGASALVDFNRKELKMDSKTLPAADAVTLPLAAESDETEDVALANNASVADAAATAGPSDTDAVIAALRADVEALKADAVYLRSLYGWPVQNGSAMAAIVAGGSK